MDDYLKEALEIARAQASVRVMSEEEITSFIQKVAAGIRTVAEGEMPVELDSADMQQDARKSIKEKSVTCLECGKTFKILTKRHLAMHGMGLQERYASGVQGAAARASPQNERHEAVGKASQGPIAQTPAARRVFSFTGRAYAALVQHMPSGGA